MSDNWVVQNLEKALGIWNDKLSEIWLLITQSPTSFKGGTLWNVVSSIHGALQAIGYALLVLFFVIGVMKTCGSLTEVKRPEHALRLFVRFALAKGVITYGMDLMLALLDIVQGVISTIMQAAGFGRPQSAVLPAEIVSAIEDCGFFESIMSRLFKSCIKQAQIAEVLHSKIVCQFIRSRKGRSFVDFKLRPLTENSFFWLAVQP